MFPALRFCDSESWDRAPVSIPYTRIGQKIVRAASLCRRLRRSPHGCSMGGSKSGFYVCLPCGSKFKNMTYLLWVLKSMIGISTRLVGSPGFGTCLSSLSVGLKPPNLLYPGIASPSRGQHVATAPCASDLVCLNLTLNRSLFARRPFMCGSFCNSLYSGTHGCITVTILGSSMATSWAFGPVLQKRALRKVFGARMQESNGPGVYRRRDSGFRVEGLNLCLSHSVYILYICIYTCLKPKTVPN